MTKLLPYFIACVLLSLFGSDANARPLEEFSVWQKAPLYTHSIAAQWTIMGDRYLADGDIDHALPLYDKALALDKNFPPAYCNRARCYLTLSRTQEALNDLNRCISFRGPEQPVALNLLARIQFDLHHYTEAISLYNDLLLGGRNFAILRDRANCYESLGKFDLAIADLTEALKYTPRIDLVLSRRARVYSRLQQYDKAIADCSKILEYDPDGSKSADANVGVLKLRAEIYKKLGKDALAKHDLEAVQKAYKNDDALAPFTRD